MVGEGGPPDEEVGPKRGGNQRRRKPKWRKPLRMLMRAVQTVAVVDKAVELLHQGESPLIHWMSEALNWVLETIDNLTGW